MGNYAKDDMETEKDVNLLMNTNNEESYYDNNSSYYDSNVKPNVIRNSNDFESSDINNFFDIKIKSDFDNESKYNNFTKDPK